MIPPIVAAASGVIDRDTGREWLNRELSRSEYAENDLTPLEQLGRWLGDAWAALLSAALGGNSPWLLLLVVAAVAVLIGLIVWRVRRLGLRRARMPLAAFDAVVTTPRPEPWRESARAAHERGDHRTAVIDEARAIFAVLGLKHVIDLEAAQTANEITRVAGTALSAHATALRRVSRVFDDLMFGPDDELGPIDLAGVYAEFLALDAELDALPAHRGAPARSGDASRTLTAEAGRR